MKQGSAKRGQLKPGKLCRHGHDHGRGKSLRYVATGACLECRFRSRLHSTAAEFTDDYRRINVTAYIVRVAAAAICDAQAQRITKHHHNLLAAMFRRALTAYGAKP